VGGGCVVVRDALWQLALFWWVAGYLLCTAAARLQVLGLRMCTKSCWQHGPGSLTTGRVCLCGQAWEGGTSRLPASWLIKLCRVGSDVLGVPGRTRYSNPHHYHSTLLPDYLPACLPGWPPTYAAPLALGSLRGRICRPPYLLRLILLMQMAGGGRGVVLGPCDPATWHPDLDWLEQALAAPSPPKMVVITNPCNPTGKKPSPGPYPPLPHCSGRTSMCTLTYLSVQLHPSYTLLQRQKMWSPTATW
jgi:hypothetical protein